jgi:pilus assembly protein CpaF
MDVREAVARAVSDRVRTSGVDPVRDPARVDTIVDSVIGDLFGSDAAETAGLTQHAWRDLIADIRDDVAGLGPIQRLLNDPEVEEVWINEPGRVFVAKSGVSELTTILLTSAQVRDIVERMLRPSGRRIDISSPFVDATLPDGSRLHVVIPDITRTHWAVNIRKFVAPATSLRDLVSLGALTHDAADFLERSVHDGRNIVVSGGTQAGKTTLLRCLLNAVPSRERVVTCEEVFELDLSLPDWVAMQTRQPSLEGTGEVPLRRLIKEALRMRPNRLVVGEVRQEEALDLLIALNSGMPGMCSVHANSAREAIVKLCTLPLLAGPNVTSQFVTPTVASAIDVVVHTSTAPGGRRGVREIVELHGITSDGDLKMATLFSDRGDGLQRP